MDFNDYQEQAEGYVLPTADAIYVFSNLVAEVGELFGKVAKNQRDGPTFTAEDMAKEVGDILWHLAIISNRLGYSMNDVAQMNLDKLASRKERGVLGGSGDDR